MLSRNFSSFTSAKIQASERNGSTSVSKLVWGHSGVELVALGLQQELDGYGNQVKWLILRGVPFSPADHWLLYDACIYGVNMLKALLLHPNIDLNYVFPGHKGERLLHFVLRTRPSDFSDGVKKEDVVWCLVRYGVNLAQTDRLGDTALHVAAGNGEDVLLRYLLAHPICAAAINQRNRYGNTALIVATLYDKAKCVRVLLDHGADPEIKGEVNRSALSFALQRGTAALLAHPALIEAEPQRRHSL